MALGQQFPLAVVQPVLEILETPQLLGEVVNIGTGKEISIGDLIRLIGECMGVELTIRSDQKRIRPEKSEVDRLQCDSSKMQRLTKWRPRVGLREGLNRTIEWMKSNARAFKADIYNV